jgi:transcriptional regulator with XRE-family HTH domain
MKHYELKGHSVALLREQAGLTQAELAEKCEISPTYMSLLETGTRQPSSAVTLRLAAALEVKFAEITRTKAPQAEPVTVGS